MNEQAAKFEILKALAEFHDAQHAGDVDRMVAAFTDMPQGLSNGVPRTMDMVRGYFESQVESFKTWSVDMTRATITLDPNPESFWRYKHGVRVSAEMNAVIEPVKYAITAGDSSGVGPQTGTGRTRRSDTVFMSYTMVKEDDGMWRIVHDQVMPDPDGEAYTRDLLADAGRVLDKATMVWTRKLDAPIEKVWQAVSTRKGLVQWWLGRDEAGFDIDLTVGGVFRHHWSSRICQLEEHALIDFNECRIELAPDGDGTLLTFVVYTMNGDEWRAFWRAEAAPIYYEQFGGMDPWAASGWHHILDRLEEVITGRPLAYSNEDNPDFSWLPDARLNHFYRVHLRDLHRLHGLSKKEALKPVGADPSQFGLPRTEREYDPPKPVTDTGPKVEDARVDLIDLDAQPALVIEGEATIDQYLAHVAQGLAKIAAYLKDKNSEPAGRPFIRNLTITQEGATRSIQYAVGYPMADDDKGAGDIKKHELPGGKALTIAFTGDYQQAIDGWSAIIKSAHDRAIALPEAGWPGNGGWHVFVDDPRVVGLGKAESRLYLPIP